MKTVVALYNNVENATRAVSALTDAGIRANDINMISANPDHTDAGRISLSEGEPEAGAAGEGAVAGGVLGGLAGVLLGLGAFAVPGLGPVIAAGPLASGLIGAAVGAASGGLIGALVEWGIGEEEAEFYLEGVRRGGALVAVRAEDEQAETVARLMDQPGLVDIEAAVGDWREEGWSGYSGEFDDVAFDTVDGAFREHYQTTYGGADNPYASFAPTYRFGYFAATDERFLNRPWNEVEPEVESAWRAEYGDRDWDMHREAVRFSFETALLYRT